MTRGHRGWLFLRCKALSCFPSCRFILVLHVLAVARLDGFEPRSGDGRVHEIEERLEAMRVRFQSSRGSCRSVPQDGRGARGSRAWIRRTLQGDRERPRVQA